MRKTIREFVLTLKGPTSTYCNCSSPCSNLEVDHVLPVWYVKQELEDNANPALRDPHNLYRCCSNMNKKKGPFMLESKFIGNEISGLLARSYLYMNWRYDIHFDDTILSYLKSMSIINSPFEFEKKRAEEILIKTGNVNPFVKYYPRTNFTKMKQ